MTRFGSMRVATAQSKLAPDGSEVRPLLRLAAGSMAHFALAPGQTSKAVAHRTVEELWLVLSGRGELWRWQEGREEVVALEAGVCVSIPHGTRFQLRSLGAEPLRIVGVTMPPWPGASTKRCRPKVTGGPPWRSADNLRPCAKPRTARRRA